MLFQWICTAVVAYYSGWFSPDHCCRSYHNWYHSSASRRGGAGGGWEGRSGGGSGCGQRVDPGVLARQQGNPSHCSPSSGCYGPCSKVEDNAAAAKVSFLYLKGTVFGWTFVFFFRNMVSFGFDARHLTDGSVPAVQCAVCGKEEWTPFFELIMSYFIPYIYQP